MNKKNILEINNQKFSSLLADFFICKYCHYIDRSIFRVFAGHKCGICQKTEDAGTIYFSSSVTYLLNLMQEAYHSRFYIENGDTVEEKSTNTHYLSIILFFTTLKEVLLQKLLDELFYVNEIPKRIYERLLSDNKLFSQKKNKLFYTMTNCTWEDAIKLVDIKDEINYAELNNLLKHIADVRNKFLHEGRDFLITKELAEDCILNISPLLNLHVRLHNDFVHPYYLSK